MPDVVPSIEPLPSSRNRVRVWASTIKVTSGRPPDTARTYFDVSDGLRSWLATHHCSIALSSYDTGQLFLIGSAEDAVTICASLYPRAMGLAFRDGTLWLSTEIGIQRIVNTGARTETKDGFDAVFIPRAVFIIGQLDFHEMSIGQRGGPIFVNTSYSCICRLHHVHSFSVIWKPSFIRVLKPGDACHLNGLGLEDGRIRCVTAFAEAESAEGWRAMSVDSGLVIDVRSNTSHRGFSKPHSPRSHLRSIWVIDSGRGYLVRICPDTGERENIALLPGFARGLSFISHYALITTSLPREEQFNGLDLQQNLGRQGIPPQCALVIVDLRNGKIVEYIKFIGRTRELFDVCILPSIASPILVQPQSPVFSKYVSGAVDPQHSEFAEQS